MRWGRRVELLFALAVVTPGCGGDTKSQADCRTFIADHYCPAVERCDPGAISQADCVTAAASGLDCSKVVGEGDVAACDADQDAEPCDVFIDAAAGVITPPMSCDGVFRF